MAEYKFRMDAPNMRNPGNRNIAEIVKRLRAQLRLTQEQFAVEIGVTWSTVNRWENGRGKPSPLALQKIRDLINEMGADGAGFLKELFPEGK